MTTSRVATVALCVAVGCATAAIWVTPLSVAAQLAAVAGVALCVGFVAWLASL